MAAIYLGVVRVKYRSLPYKEYSACNLVDLTELEEWGYEYNHLQLLPEIYSYFSTNIASNTNSSTWHFWAIYPGNSSRKDRRCNYLNPIEEEEVDTEQATAHNILQEVIDEHLGFEYISKDEEEEQVQRQHTTADALGAIHVLTECVETTKNLLVKYIRSLESLETVFKSIQVQSRGQRTLDSWLT